MVVCAMVSVVLSVSGSELCGFSEVGDATVVALDLDDGSWWTAGSGCRASVVLVMMLMML